MLAPPRHRHPGDEPATTIWDALEAIQRYELDPPNMLDAVVALSVELFGATAGWFSDDGADGRTHLAGNDPLDWVEAVPREGVEDAARRGGSAITTVVPGPGGQPTRVAAAPVALADRILGVLCIAGAHGPDDLPALELIASHAAVGLDSGRRHASAAAEALTLREAFAGAYRLTGVLFRNEGLQQLQRALDDLVSPPTRVLVAPDAAPDAPEDHGEPIMSAGSQLGCIVVEGGSSRMTTVDRYLVADAARLVAIELRRQQAVDEAESTFRGTLLEELVDLPDGASGARARIALRLQQAGLDLLRVTPLIALQAVDTAIDPTYVLRRVRDGAARLSGQMVSKVLAFERAGRIVLATHSSDGDSMVRNLASQLASHLADVGLPVLVGVSGSTTNVADAHLQAITCLQILRDRGDDGGVLRAEDLGPLAALLSVRDLGQSRSFVSEVLGELVATDRTMRIPLLETFVAYIESDGTRSSLADRLYIHPSTLKYRLGIVESVVGPSIADPDAALRFQTAVTTLRILEARGASPFSADQRPATKILEQRS